MIDIEKETESRLVSTRPVVPGSGNLHDFGGLHILNGGVKQGVVLGFTSQEKIACLLCMTWLDAIIGKKEPRRLSPDFSFQKRKVYVCGIGVVTPIGIGIESMWEGLMSGKSGIRPITRFDTSTFPVKFAGEVESFDPTQFLSKREYKYTSRQTQMALTAFYQCMEDAGVAPDLVRESAVIMGSAAGSYEEIEKEADKTNTNFREFVPGLNDPLAMPKALMASPAAQIANAAKARGYVTSVSSACTSGINAIGQAYLRIRNGDSDIALAGGADCPLYPTMITGFMALRDLSTSSINPEKVLRPYDLEANRPLLGEGAGVILLMDEQSAERTGAKVYAEITGFEQGTENVNEAGMMDKFGEEWARVLSSAIGEKELPGTIYICGHGPSHRLIDATEIRALKKSIKASPSRVILSSIKANMGNGFSAPGVAQVATGAKAVQTGWVPPTLNYENPDPDNPFRVIKKPEHAGDLSVVISAHGLAGFDTGMVLEKV